MNPINYDDNYRKGFYGNPGLWQRFYDAVQAADCDGIRDVAVRRQKALGDDYRPIAVDADIFGTHTPDQELFRQRPDTPAVGAAEFRKEAEFLQELAARRDEPLSSITDLPETLTTVSWFIKDYQQIPYKAGVDYMTTMEAWEAVQEGKKPIEQLLTENSARTIQTGRDCARFVHDDNPFMFFASAIGTLLSEKVDHRLCSRQTQCPHLGRFASVGMPFLLGGIGEVGRRVGLISFREKWTLWTPRPEQYCVDAGLGLLPQAYPEGSPMHPSRNAMHQIIYAAMGGYLKYIFNDLHVLPHGKTVGEEIDLFVANAGDWRMWSSVHYTSDNAPYIPRAEALGVKIAKEHLR